MAFSTDAAWPQGLRTIFDICRQKLLRCAAKPKTSDLSLRDTVGFVVFLVVFDANRHTVLIAEIKDDAWAHKADRYGADDQIRVVGMTQCLATVFFLVYGGLSLLGTSLRVYCGTAATETIEPPRPSPSRVLP